MGLVSSLGSPVSASGLRVSPPDSPLFGTPSPSRSRSPSHRSLGRSSFSSHRSHSRSRSRSRSESPLSDSRRSKRSILDSPIGSIASPPIGSSVSSRHSSVVSTLVLDSPRAPSVRSLPSAVPPASGHHRECLGHADSLACSVFVADLFFRNKPRQKENFLASFSVAGQVLAKHRISSTYVRFGDEHELTDGFLKLDALQHAYSKQPLTRGILVLGFGDAKTPFYLAELLRRVRRPGKTATNHTVLLVDRGHQVPQSPRKGGNQAGSGVSSKGTLGTSRSG